MNNYHLPIIIGDLYFPPTFEQDGGFVHATADPNLLLGVLNNFYRESKNDWICLEIDPVPYGDKLIYEAPMAVGGIASNQSTALKFPHIYQGIMKHTVLKRYKICREEDSGKFVSIEGI